MTSDTPKWQSWHTWAVVGGVVLLIAVPWLGPKIVDFDSLESWARARLIFWLIAVVLVLGTIAIIGRGIRGGWLGALINKENRMSLTQLQLIIWTTIVVSALFTAALTNIDVTGDDAQDQIKQALDIEIPPELWLLLGINVASVAGTTILKNVKTAKVPTQQALERAGFPMTQADGGQRVLTIDTSAKREARGLLLVNTTPTAASFADLFSGEEVGNGAYLDIGKFQMSFFTVIVVLVYAVLLGSDFADQFNIPFTAFPDFDESILTLLAISHAGYLVSLAPDHTAST
jgi:hypothetical protein